MGDELIAGIMGANETKNLHKSIVDFNEQSSKQTEQMLQLSNRMLRLTRVITFLTLIMTIGVGIQIYLTITGLSK